MTLPRRTFNRLVAQALVASASPALVASGCAAPGALSSGAASSGGGGGARSGLVILAQFPDLRHNVPRRWPQQRFSQELADYVAEMSYGRVRLTLDVTEQWRTLPRPVAQYAISPRNLEVDKSRVRRLIDDAVNAVDGETDFSRYDFTVVFLGARREEYGMIGLCGWPGMLGWSAQESLRTARGQVVKGGVAIFCYQAHVGTLFHDVAHILGGVRDGRRAVPCLYDHDLQARPGPLRQVFLDAIVNMGFWDPMSCHFYKWEVPPPGTSSWTKLRLGWIDPEQVRVVDPKQETEVLLGPLQDASSGVLVVKIPLSASTYYLVENRQPIGSDRYLPGHGVLVMYADDSVAECRRGRTPVKLVNADPAVARLEGAAFDLPARPSFTDRERRLRISLLDKQDNAYRVRVEPLPA
jgi:M6 family metalloprotease-like protein